MNKIKHFLEQSWLLIIASCVFGLGLAVADAKWRPIIIQNEIDKFNRLAGSMLTDANSFEIAIDDAEIISAKGKIIKTDIQKAVSADGQCAGWAFVCEGAGFADKIKLVLTFDPEFKKLAGFGVLFSNETPGFGDKIKTDYYRNQFAGAPVAELTLSKSGDDKKIDAEIIAISGATVSSEAVVQILNNYIEQVKTKLLAKGLIDNGK
jgi:electron transport complex protein RnfG